jgi:predicted nucleic acid-binding protein
MNLDDIENGSLCVVDTNVLLYAEQGLSQQAQRLIRRCSTGDLIGVLPQTVWQELTHKLMLAEALMMERVSGPNAGRKLSRQPDTVKRLGLYKDKILALVNMGLGFEACMKEDLLVNAFRYREQYGLLTNDSAIVAIAVRLKADVLVTADAAFQKISEIPVAMPSDITQ